MRIIALTLCVVVGILQSFQSASAAGSKATPITQPTEFDWPVLDVIDGDTVRVAIEAMPPPLHIDTVRILGVDTPETWKPKCEAELLAGEQATQFTRDAIESARRVTFKNIKARDYYHRILAELWVDGQNLATLLIDAGLGVKYRLKKRDPWCPPTRE